jgi:two-component system sensor histidine kinase/response regulator
MDLASSAFPPRRLLIVGDPALSRGLMKMVLSRLGYVVTCVVTARDCVMTMAHSQFALALIALDLPDMPGLTLARRLHDAAGPLSMPIIMFGNAWEGDRIRESCREAGLAAYLPKPISIARLVSSIHDHLHRPSTQSGAPVPMPSRPLDLARLASFTEGDRELERELTALFLSTAAGYLAELRRCLAGDGDWSSSAHSLKGASANIGAVEMARLAAEAEHAAPAPERLARLELALDAVRDFARLRLGTPDEHLRRTA